jgi:hypothetical protein
MIGLKRVVGRQTSFMKGAPPPCRRSRACPVRHCMLDMQTPTVFERLRVFASMNRKDNV